ncbi:N-acetyl-gamma-glutamyl-phosphate reductase [Oscillospiraceae bacterium MB08-C2-2]|nr:N-acetyl-gamma-glutamyl-phosphate reductase [Oscillospiraceae bacterium MB08-C2-2]
MKKIQAGIIGATGYAGLEIARILATHPAAELAAVSSVSFTGQALSQVYPSMAGIVDDLLCTDEQAVERSEVIFASLPHGLSEKLARLCFDAGKLFIDMGADFRLHRSEDYLKWYGGQFDDYELHQAAVYAIPELFREQIKGAKIIANPGCYPTSVALGLAPLLKTGAIETSGIVIDSKSGVTGAGRGLTQNTHYPDCNEAFSAYKVASHRHTPEIEQTLSALGGKPASITFVPHLLPINRGILSTMYLTLTGGPSGQELHELYTSFYQSEKFVRIMPLGESANLRNVKLSNYCDISLHPDPRTGRLVVVSVIDNMMKGAAGQAVQNMNLVCGLPEDTGLDFVPPAF